ncbi:hypothetical protein [Aquimarina sp. AU474]|uniref:hypothetical protein n=1 Tax=Aquimarina sp. AU474 TaxID=2108529 RepID=UPI00135AB1B6|nr:hypothetical protein [Aquimarina sp. AU474]
MTKSVFNIKRISLFMLRDLTILKSTITTSLYVVCGLFFISFLIRLRGDLVLSSYDFASVFGKFYIILGILFTFSVFKEAQNQKTNHLYFSLPVSSLERIAAAWLSTVILFTIILTVLGAIIGQLAILIGSMFSETSFHMVSIFSEEYWGAVTFYAIIQPLFLYGALRFKKNRIGKTLLSVLLLIFGLMIYNFMFYGILNHSYDVFSGEDLAAEAFDLTSKDFSGAGKFAFMGILTPLLLAATYFKLVEKEV